MPLPAWIIEVIKSSPTATIYLGLAWLGYKSISKIVDSPLAIAVLFSLLGTKAIRADARKTMEILRERGGG
ncbi:hypothetical protein [Actinoplanes sp. HUAS TT8]|uniref:hypothetical protein n=1 Tax=Actinoplanes sp. HUAS TT8 TaxID=3447453 RepID=UPI003F51EBA6